jgi:hypothetical protein
MSTWRPWSLLALLATTIAAQQERPHQPKPSPAQTKVIARMRADMTAASKRLTKTPHAYKGTLSVAPFSKDNAMVPMDLDFTGATDGRFRTTSNHARAHQLLRLNKKGEPIAATEKPGKPKKRAP